MEEQTIEQQVQGRVELLRAVMKLSVAMNDLDTIEFEKHFFKNEFKIKSKLWSAAFQVFTGKLMQSLVEIDSSMLDNVYRAFDDNGIMIEAKKQNKKPLIMFYIKLKSALIDLEAIEDRSKIFPAPILYKFTNDLIIQVEKQYSFIKNLEDESGKSINSLIQYYNDAGKKILHYGEIN